MMYRGLLKYVTTCCVPCMEGTALFLVFENHFSVAKFLQHRVAS